MLREALEKILRLVTGPKPHLDEIAAVARVALQEDGDSRSCFLSLPGRAHRFAITELKAVHQENGAPLRVDITLVGIPPSVYPMLVAAVGVGAEDAYFAGLERRWPTQLVNRPYGVLESEMARGARELDRRPTNLGPHSGRAAGAPDLCCYCRSGGNCGCADCNGGRFGQTCHVT